MTTRAFIISLIMSFNMIAAAHEYYSDCDTVGFPDFTAVRLRDLQPVDTASFEFVAPCSLTILNDSMMLYTEEGTSPLLRVLNFRSGDCTGYIEMGTGSYQMHSIRNISYSDSTVSVFDDLSGKYAEFTLKPDCELSCVKWITLSGSMHRVVNAGSGNLLLHGAPSTEHMFQIFSSDSEKSVSFGDFPDVPIREGVNPSVSDFQSFIDVSPRGDRFVSSLIMWDIVRIYDAATLKCIRRIRGPLMHDNELAVKRYANGFSVKMTSSDIFAVGKIKSSGGGFSVGLAGSDKLLLNGFREIRYIASYDWDGRPLRLIECNESTLDFAYDIDSGLLYVFTVDDGGKVKLERYEI